MRRYRLIIAVLFAYVGILQAQHGFPEGHYCNSEEGWNTKNCRALDGLKNHDQDKVIVIPHRGVWGAEGIPETSLVAVTEAYNQGYMFCEVDLIMTKDRKLLLFHDQQVDRATDAPPTFTNDGGGDDHGNFIRSMNYNSVTLNTVPDKDGKIYPSFPPLKNLQYTDRQGNITGQTLNTFEQLLDYSADKQIILTLDLKAVKITDPTIRNEYFEAIKLILQIAKEKNALHRIALKPGASGQVKVSELKNYLEPLGLWKDFSQHTNIILINIIGAAFPLATNKEYLDAWLSLPSLIGVEHIYKNKNDELLQPKAEFGNKSIVQYTKEKGIRTGVFHPTPNDVSGAANGRGGFYNPKNYGTIDDLRGSMEFLFSVPQNVFPGMIVTDRADVDINFLELFDLNSIYTKRTDF